jgi:hypothetical protein
MITTHHLARITQPKLKKFAAGTVLVGGLGIAVVGLPAAIVNADPAPLDPATPTVTASRQPAAPCCPPHSESGLCQDTPPGGVRPLPNC